MPTSRIAVITGASAGIGRASAIALAEKGWHIIGIGRNQGRSAEAEKAIRAASAGGSVTFLRADFDSMADVRRVAGEIAALGGKIDLLVNNAGGVRDARYETVDGLEATFAANHLAAFLISRELLPLMGKGSRIIAVSSKGHEYCAGMAWDDLQSARDFHPGKAYCQAKLANILFTRELARRVGPLGIAAQAMHPGKTASNFASHADAQMKRHYDTLDCLPPEHPARTIAWMAEADEAGLPGARYFFDMAEIAPAPQALDDEAAARLWAESEAILDRLGIA